MHPAYSVIFFTVASGAGYGLLFWAAILALGGRLPDDPAFVWPVFVLGFGLVTAGLLSSLAHLGHPERFLKALTQWRSSWLSREGVLSLATYAPAGLFALAWLFVVGDPTRPGVVVLVLAALTAVLCALTVFTTAMIYASLKPIPQWHRRDVPFGYLALAAASGAVLLNAIGQSTGATGAPVLWGTVAALAVALVLKHVYWRAIESAPRVASAGAAIGLDPDLRVRLLDPPNTSPNYLQKEMGYRIARKHAAKLRRISSVLGFDLPILALIAAALAGGVATPLLSIAAALGTLAGTAVERWLFFAEATHAVTLYYGAERV